MIFAARSRQKDSKIPTRKAIHPYIICRRGYEALDNPGSECRHHSMILRILFKKYSFRILNVCNFHVVAVLWRIDETAASVQMC